MESSSPLKVVAMGGGTGLSALLEGLKHYTHASYLPPVPLHRVGSILEEGDAGRSAAAEDAPHDSIRAIVEGHGSGAQAPSKVSPPPQVDITAIVTVTDDGGSSGRLRREFDVLPPGDIRNCMLALSEDSALLSRLFQYRFSAGRGLKGHSFGNLFLMALTQVMGDFPDAVKASSEVLNIAGRIYPATAQNVNLEAVMSDGSRVVGETRISRSSRGKIERIHLIPRDARPLPATLEAIGEADVITLGPGSLFTSVVPNLLVRGIPNAIRKSRAIKVYFVNLMWQPGETTGFRASDHVRVVHQHAGGKFLDYAVINVRRIPAAIKKRYARSAALEVENDLDEIFKMGVNVFGGRLANDAGKVRHDPAATAAVVVKLAQEGRQRRART